MLFSGFQVFRLSSYQAIAQVRCCPSHNPGKMIEPVTGKTRQGSSGLPGLGDDR